MNPKYCFHCGTPLVPGGSYCPECGRYQPPLAVNPYRAEAVPCPAPAERAQPPRAERSRSRRSSGLRASQWLALFLVFILIPLSVLSSLAYSAAVRNSGDYQSLTGFGAANQIRFSQTSTETGYGRFPSEILEQET